MPLRINGLDFLRGVAILLVLFRHSWQTSILNFIGWIGVDLFFVLSGFLVSGLLFKEYSINKNVNVKRFLARRAFKIYPSFYFFIIVCVALKYILKHYFYPIEALLAEIFYLQNYLPNIWQHTWSLAVEEHFYLGLSFLVYVSVKFDVLEKRDAIISFLLLCLIVVFSLRWQACLPHKDEMQFVFFQTHLRVDGVITGLLLAYLFYFTSLLDAFRRKPLLILVLACMLVSPAFILPGGSFIMNTVGMSALNIGLALFVLLSLDANFLVAVRKFKIGRQAYGGICFIGIHSYSIYIWHLIAQRLSFYFVDGHTTPGTLFYILIAISLGIVFSFLIERPFLRMRDTLFKANLP